MNCGWLPTDTDKVVAKDRLKYHRLTPEQAAAHRKAEADALDRLRGAVFHGPMCRCGSRNTRLLFGLRRFCHDCNRIFELRVCGGDLLAFTPEVAAGIDDLRRGRL